MGNAYFVAEFDETLAAGPALGSRLGVGAENEEDEAEFEEGADGIVPMRGDQVTPNYLRSRNPDRPLCQLRSPRLRVLEPSRFHHFALNLVGNQARKRVKIGQTRLRLDQIDANRMGIDLLLLQDDKGGDLASVKLSEQRRGGDETLVDSVLAMYKEWVRGNCTA